MGFPERETLVVPNDIGTARFAALTQNVSQDKTRLSVDRFVETSFFLDAQRCRKGQGRDARGKRQ